ncbi:hypothetical protein QBZ16_004784 [Prototheca wickerhamii]|uniref:uroporphyrinogen-III C-methyltransferase n=1 Tax=Prototheca wickerhamii TaxID=3111 RepID=A0AAD9IID8_PROWI|nr:hypothetical protein QBZ16_004784 [Prototheca wickerhamii]
MVVWRRARAATSASNVTGAGWEDNASFLEFYMDLLRKQRPGHVYLVGTGPGDPELLTLKALHAMQTADVVLYDRLVSPEILAHVGARALMVYVGKQRGFHTRTQAEIHELLLGFAGQGARVLGIPLTHRGLATAVTFATGHARDGELSGRVADAARDPDATLVVYMGLGTLRALRDALVVRGTDPRTPAAAVERGTTPDQRAVFAPLGALPDAVERAGLQSPTLLVIGAVVSVAPGWEAALASPDGTALLEGLEAARDGPSEASGDGSSDLSLPLPMQAVAH